MPAFVEHYMPYISANMLGESSSRRESRRQQILKDQRSPSEPVAYYNRPSRPSAATCSASRSRRKSSVPRSRCSPPCSRSRRQHGGEDRLQTSPRWRPFSPTPERDFLDGLETFPGPRRASLHVAGVEIAVRPEIIVADPLTNSFGFMKLRFCRRRMPAEVGDYVAAVLVAYTQSCAAQFSGTLNLDLTCVVDVFAGSVARGQLAEPGPLGARPRGLRGRSRRAGRRSRRAGRGTSRRAGGWCRTDFARSSRMGWPGQLVCPGSRAASRANKRSPHEVQIFWRPLVPRPRNRFRHPDNKLSGCCFYPARSQSLLAMGGPGSHATMANLGAVSLKRSPARRLAKKRSTTRAARSAAVWPDSRAALREITAGRCRRPGKLPTPSIFTMLP